MPCVYTASKPDSIRRVPRRRFTRVVQVIRENNLRRQTRHASFEERSWDGVNALRVGQVDDGWRGSISKYSRVR